MSLFGLSCTFWLRRTNFTSLQHIRGAKRLLKKSNIPVRLLQDVPKFGRKGSIINVQRGRMRYIWHPYKQAEYMTAAMLKMIPQEAILHERDVNFIPEIKEKKGVNLELLAPEQTIAILDSFLPPVLQFARPTTSPDEPTIMGSITSGDISTAIRAIAQSTGEEGSRVVVKEENVSIVGLGDDGQVEITDKVKRIGTFAFDIRFKGAEDFIRRKLVIRKQVEE